MINEVDQRFCQLDHVTFLKNEFWSVNCTLLLPNQSRPNVNCKAGVKVDILVRSCTPESISRKSHVTTLMTFIILKSRSELQNLMKKFQSVIKI